MLNEMMPGLGKSSVNMIGNHDDGENDVATIFRGPSLISSVPLCRSIQLQPVFLFFPFLQREKISRGCGGKNGI